MGCLKALSSITLAVKQPETQTVATPLVKLLPASNIPYDMQHFNLLLSNHKGGDPWLSCYAEMLKIYKDRFSQDFPFKIFSVAMILHSVKYSFEYNIKHFGSFKIICDSLRSKVDRKIQVPDVVDLNHIKTKIHDHLQTTNTQDLDESCLVLLISGKKHWISLGLTVHEGKIEENKPEKLIETSEIHTSQRTFKVHNPFYGIYHCSEQAFIDYIEQVLKASNAEYVNFLTYHPGKPPAERLFFL